MKVVARIVILLAAWASVPEAFAHAFLDHAVPAVGSTIHGSPTEVKLWFTGELEPAFSTGRVFDGKGRQVDRMDQRVERGGTTLLRVSVPRLAPGSYRVVWRVLSVDAHLSEGDFIFIVAD